MMEFFCHRLGTFVPQPNEKNAARLTWRRLCVTIGSPGVVLFALPGAKPSPPSRVLCFKYTGFFVGGQVGEGGIGDWVLGIGEHRPEEPVLGAGFCNGGEVVADPARVGVVGAEAGGEDGEGALVVGARALIGIE